MGKSRWSFSLWGVFHWIISFLVFDESIFTLFGAQVLRVSSLSPSPSTPAPKISTRLTLSVCQQRTEFFNSKVIQTPVKTGAELLKGNGQKPEIGCGWFDFGSGSQIVYKTCGELGRGQETMEMGEKVESESSGAGRIIGGQDATKGQFPSIVSMGTFPPPESGSTKLTHFCGGIILDKEWVLTAQHCFGNFPTDVAVAGEHQGSVNESTEQYVNIVKSRDPQQFNGSDYLFHDIALAKVSPPFTFNEFVQPASLPPAGYEPSGTLVIAGWGYTKIFNSTSTEGNGLGNRDVPMPPRGETSDILQFTPIPIVPSAECRAALGPSGGAPNHVCVGFQDGHANSCNGDSGGPLYDTIDGKVTVVGVTSLLATLNCSEPGKPNTYMKVSFPYYIEWIKKTMEENS